MYNSLSEKIKRLTLTALVSDDSLLEKLTLKGGNALTMIHKLNERGSKDLDFSIEDNFEDDPQDIANLMERLLSETFSENGYIVIDFNFKETPRTISDDMRNFWGGYDINFKIVEEKVYQANIGNKEALSRSAVAVSENRSSKIEIDISKFEYVGDREQHYVDGLLVHVYTPIMILFEKVRALCQQTHEYDPIVKRDRNSPKGRARDFYDIYSIIENVPGLNIFDEENKDILKHVFDAKRVPLEFIYLIKNYKTVHEDNFVSVRNTLGTGTDVKDFDFYFDYTIKNFEALADTIIKDTSDNTDANS